ncbi:MOB kinase activator-like 2 isoform X2 [Chironomus tepperi]|uniref:MOB kinase activator-like 2 isoform X2 n=1 Tax=Chironomus tepperi TaxID=113505 RepID=UPI00391F9BEA
MLRSPAHIIGPTTPATTTSGLFDSCHRKIRLIGGNFAFFGGLMSKARRKERDDAAQGDTKLYLEESVLELLKFTPADLRSMVDLPTGVDYNEWLASYTIQIFEYVNLVYGTISEHCTTNGCPDMTAPQSKTYLWYDEKGKKNRCPAPQYIDYVMTYTQRTISDESYFPTKYAKEFPSGFESHVRKMLRLLFHVIAHMYAAHFREIALLGLHPHLNSTYALLVALQRRFNLIEPKEMEVLADLEQALHLSDDVSTTPSSCSVASNNNSSSSCNSNCNLNSNTVTQAIISSSSPLRSIGGVTTNSTSINTPLDGGLNVHNSQIDDVTVIVKQPLISDSATSMLNNNNDLAMKDRVLVSTSVDAQPI